MGSGHCLAAPDLSEAYRDPPDGFQLTVFARPPQVNYPVCVCAAPTGELFVGIDRQGSVGKKPGEGRVERCVDTDGDGVADKFNTFARMDHPRGIFYDDGRMWVLHPPSLTLYHDDDRDGVADRSETLVTGITTEQITRQGADHTTNGIRLGIDGWIYIAVGDFGFLNAKGKDGRVVSLKGGGVARIRPDGTELEVFARGLRNIVDVCIDPQLNMFARDNTNDGGGWDVRLPHIVQSANYGYPSLYKNFPEEAMPPLKDYGGGSGCGGLFVSEPWLPEKYRRALLTCDWGRQRVYFHPLTPQGATFHADQEAFLRIGAPTDADVDGRGRIFISSWFGGGFTYKDEHVGLVVQLRPKDDAAPPFPNLAKLSDDQLVQQLQSPSHVLRLHAQLQILRRGDKRVFRERLLDLARSNAPVDQRVAAVFTYKQLRGAKANTQLATLIDDPQIREFAIRALTDRLSQLQDVPLDRLTKALRDSNPRVRLSSVIGLGRLGDLSAAPGILTLARSTNGQPDATENTSDRALNHAAIKALARLRAVDVCLQALGGTDNEEALKALREMHDMRVIDGVVAALNSTSDPLQRKRLLTTLIRLYHRESDYDGSWWSTRPDTHGPYYHRVTWTGSAKVELALLREFDKNDKTTTDFLMSEFARHKVQLDGSSVPQAVDTNLAKSEASVAVPVADTDNADLIANRDPKEVLAEVITAKGDVEAGRALFTRQQCIACHTVGKDESPVGPPLAGISKRYNRRDLAESVLDPTAKIAQGFTTQWFVTTHGKQFMGFVVREASDDVELRTRDGRQLVLKKDEIDERGNTSLSSMPGGLANNLTVAQLASLMAYLESLKEE